jgi:hypothetical protein
MDSENIIIIIAMLALVNLIVSFVCLYKVKDNSEPFRNNRNILVDQNKSGSLIKSIDPSRLSSKPIQTPFAKSGSQMGW